MKLLNDWIRIKFDPETEKIIGSTLIRPLESYETTFRTAKVMQVGPGRWSKPKKGETLRRCPVGVEVGEGVLVVRFIAKTRTSEAVQHHLGKDEILIAPKDILLAFDHKNPPELL